MVKVIINENKATIDHIIASTYSQNPVSPSLLRATDEIQRDIELFFLNLGYYYDRRKNYYKNQGKPASKIFGIQTNAQAVEAIMFNNPHITRSKPTSLIKDDVAYNRIFNKGYSYNVYLTSCLIAQRSAELLRNHGDVVQKSTLSNFKLHLARIVTSFITNKSLVTKDDIALIDLSTLDQEKFDNSVALLINAITEYQTNNSGANLINMAKTKQFTDFMLTKLTQKF